MYRLTTWEIAEVMDQSPSQDVRFRRLFDAHRDAVRAYCFRRVGSDRGDDATADVFVVAWRRIEEAPTGHQALLWLYGIARNVVRNSRRSQQRWHRLRLRMGSLGELREPGPEVQVVRRAEDRQLLDAVAQLSPMEQELLRLRTWEELSPVEIAAVTGLSVRAVETRLSRTRKKLSLLLGPSSSPTSVISGIRSKKGVISHDR